MPNQTFYNLPDAKRQRLMDAVWREFTTVSYMDASINRIIQSAEISRGSFYQYFSGKQDVFAYVLDTVLKTLQDIFLAQLTAHSNDLFGAILGMYDTILWRRRRGNPDPRVQQFHQLFQLNTELDMSQFAIQPDCSAVHKTLESYLIRSGYDPGSPLRCSALLHMLISISLSNLMETMRHPEHEEQNRRLLEEQLLLIRRGLRDSQKEGPLC